MTISDTARVLKILSTAYPTWRAAESAETLALWHEMLSDLPDALVLVAVKRLIATSPFPPSIADVRKNAVETMEDGNDRLSGDEAWGMLVEAIRRNGFHQFERARAMIPDEVWEVAKDFGWAELCSMTYEQQGYIRAQFIRIFDARVTRRKTSMQVPAGIHEMGRQLAAEMSLTEVLGIEDGGKTA